MGVREGLQTFRNEFFAVYGNQRRTAAAYEHPVEISTTSTDCDRDSPFEWKPVGHHYGETFVTEAHPPSMGVETNARRNRPS
jgi:hypothetical protein